LQGQRGTLLFDGPMKRRPVSRRTAPALLLLSALLAAAPSAPAQGLTHPLTATQVACSEIQLERMFGRMRLRADQVPSLNLPTTLFLSYSNSVGFYDGLAISNQFQRVDVCVGCSPTPAEHYLAFHINPSVRTLLLNPARRTLGQVSISREQSTSNLVPGGQPTALVLKLNPALPENPNPLELEINNYEVPAIGKPYNGFLASSTGPGRGLTEDGLLTPCHDLFTQQDRQVFSILQRIVRIKSHRTDESDEVDESFGPFSEVEVAIFRSESENAYRLDVYANDYENLQPHGRVALALNIDWTPEGHLTSGLLQVLPPCSGGLTIGCTTTDLAAEIFFVPPVFAGHEYWLERVPSNRLISFDPTKPLPQPITIDFEALLEKATWN